MAEAQPLPPDLIFQLLMQQAAQQQQQAGGVDQAMLEALQQARRAVGGAASLLTPSTQSCWSADRHVWGGVQQHWMTPSPTAAGTGRVDPLAIPPERGRDRRARGGGEDKPCLSDGTLSL